MSPKILIVKVSCLNMGLISYNADFQCSGRMSSCACTLCKPARKSKTDERMNF
ncbi:MAG: hypothetical protein IJE85_05665 [Bacteroidales bacterium]|nr:hypothetical protein [Bacteroidales bacterium]